MFFRSSANHSHMMALLQQLLYSESLSLSWRDVIVPVVRTVVQTVRPDVRSCDDDMDIRQLVHIKKVRPSVCVCVCVCGVCLGNVAKAAACRLFLIATRKAFCLDYIRISCE